MLLSERIKRDKITIEHTYDDAPAHIDYASALNSVWYSIKLKMGTRRMTVPFGMGQGLERYPDAHDVLSCLIMDASTVEGIGGYYEWCHDLGFDSGESRNREIYGAVLGETRKLRRFLGDKYNAYLYDTEDDD